MTDSLEWPQQRPASGLVSLRAFEARDVDMAEEMSKDPYIPLIGSLPAHADREAALAWIRRQQSRHVEGVGFSFCVADRQDRAVGSAGLWTHDFWEGRATAGYAVRPSARGRGLAAHALRALTEFGFILSLLHRVELYIEPDNWASRRTAERVGHLLEGTLRQHQEIGGQRRDMCLYARFARARRGARAPFVGAGQPSRMTVGLRHQRLGPGEARLVGGSRRRAGSTSPSLALALV